LSEYLVKRVGLVAEEELADWKKYCLNRVICRRPAWENNLYINLPKQMIVKHNSQSVGAKDSGPNNIHVNEGASMPLQWKNIYILPEHSRFNVSNKQITFSLDINGKKTDFPWLDSTTYMLRIRINPVNDPPELTGTKGVQVIKISAKGSRTLTSDHILLSDPDDGPDKVLTLHTISTPVEVRLKTNTGVRLLHHSSALITSNNLSFTASVPDLPLSFSIVGLPDHGVVECSPSNGHFAVCSTFTQEQIDKGLVRFRHTSSHHPTQDMFSFQVESGEFVSMIHNFRLMFIPMNVKVFNREVFMLNGTETGTLNRGNLFAWTFPKSYPPEKLVYHIEEPPKYGILSRRINGKSRRIGVSSNFTQADIDNRLISFKLHFMQYSIINDFFLFRVITPAISSESLRFEIIFIPSQTSIQLVNRTVVVQEGDSATVTQDSLSLATPDDSFFVFTLALPPAHGSLLLKTSNFTNRTLSTGMNFTTRDIAEERLIYSHSGSESRTDRLHLIAESAFRKGRRIPFWMSFSVIPVNDNRPRLRGSHIIQIVERGERVLHPDLLDWVDDDHDGVAPLQFNFYQPIKDAAVLSTVSPYLPMTIFTEQDLINGRVMLRHLGHKNNFTVSYTVSDKKHTVEGLVRIVASDPFVRIGESLLEYCCLPGDTPNLPVGPANLSVITNLDVRPEDIVYQSQSDSFVMQYQKYRRPIRTFTQKDINNGKISYNVHSAVMELLTVRVANRTLKAEVQILRRSLGASLELRRSSTLTLPVGGVGTIDSNHLEIGDAVSSANELVYRIIKQPQEGALVLEQENSTSTPSIIVGRFSQRDVDLGRVQYIHSGSGSGRDTIQFNISSPHTTKGPYTFYVEIYDHHVSMTSTPLNVVAGGSTVVSGSVLNVTSSDREDYVVNVVEKPNYGWIVLDSWNTNNISSIESFSGADLRERRVVYVSDRDSAATRDSFSVAVCISHHTCTQTQTVDITISQRNVQSPQLLRNEILRVTSERTPITNAHLDTEDPDTPPSGVFYLISKPSNGMVVNINDLSKEIYNFSQKEVDDSAIIFLRQANASGSGGFSFLLSDGLHQIGPEWFSIESSASSSPVLQTNARLLASPNASTVIGVESLRASIPNVMPHLYYITDSIGVYTDPQDTLYIPGQTRRDTSSGAPQKEWTLKDSFYFVLQKNGSDKPIEEEFRFRVASTYAALQDPTKGYVKTTPLNISKGGSAALTKAHFDISVLAASAEKESLIIEVSTPPRYGVLEFLDGAAASMYWSDFQSEPKLIYRNGGEESKDDSVTFFIYPASEKTRRSSRLRITVPIHIRTPRDPLVQVTSFPSSISVRNSGVVPLTAKQFHASHPHVPAQSIVYELTQPGTAGTEIRVNDGLVSIGHVPASMAMSSHDVITLSVEGHSRALIVRIKPLDLALENHTVIEYPQGKTYVVLNRTHLGAYSNGDRTAITYKITKGPENGTFYWVAGEKEAKQFTQKDIDDGKILYAQLNMNSYKDSFEFLLANTEKGVVRNRSEIRVKSLVTAQPVIVETNTVVPLTPSQLNATALQGSTPRFLVTSSPRYGRISLDPDLNHSALFFTFPDILRSRVYFQAFATDREVTEELELEVRADSVQPARLILPITIIPADLDVQERSEIEKTANGKRNETEIPKSRLLPAGDQLPVIVLMVVLFITVFVLLCRRKRPKPKIETPQEQPSRSPKTSLQEKPDLLGSTVFASVGKASDMSPRQPLRTFERPQVTPLSKRRHQPSLDYAGLATDTPPPMPLFKQLTAQRSDAQHWV
uniref:Cadherin domain-containing protein n=1 Tax=Haemonchus placei TaxID=6290 RepID=A0A0N4WQI5_HAEPC